MSLLSASSPRSSGSPGRPSETGSQPGCRRPMTANSTWRPWSTGSSEREIAKRGGGGGAAALLEQKIDEVRMRKLTVESARHRPPRPAASPRGPALRGPEGEISTIRWRLVRASVGSADARRAHASAPPLEDSRYRGPQRIGSLAGLHSLPQVLDMQGVLGGSRTSATVAADQGPSRDYWTCMQLHAPDSSGMFVIAPIRALLTSDASSSRQATRPAPGCALPGSREVRWRDEAMECCTPAQTRGF